nr:TraC family protein [Escherichia coli]
MNNPLEAVTQAVNSLVTALKLPDESAKANEVLGEMSFPQFSRLLPYRDYNQESGLFMNDTTMGFMLEAIPINGANESIVEALDHMLRTKLPRGIPLCIHLMSSQLVGDRIEYGLREFSWSGEQAERFNAITRAYYMKAAATQFPLPEGMNLPLTLRHYRVFISYCSPSKKKSRADILEMENLVKIIRASLQGASITTQTVDAQAFIDIVGEMINHNPDSLYRTPRNLKKTGFIENVYANQIAFGRLYREKLKEQVEALGYETEVVGKHGMWEMPGVPVEAFSGRSQTIREAVGEDASLKSRDVAALDTRKSKQHVDPEVRMAEWMQTLKETRFDIRAYRDAADQRAETRTQAPGAVSQEGPDVQQAVTQAIAGLSERKVQFTYTDVLARTVGILPPENGVIERARAGIDEAISREQLIPLDREKGLFTSGIHVLDELSWPCRAAVTERACWLIICRMVSGLPVIILTAVWW